MRERERNKKAREKEREIRKSEGERECVHLASEINRKRKIERRVC